MAHRTKRGAGGRADPERGVFGRGQKHPGHRKDEGAAPVAPPRGHRRHGHGPFLFLREPAFGHLAGAGHCVRSGAGLLPRRHAVAGAGQGARQGDPAHRFGKRREKHRASAGKIRPGLGPEPMDHPFSRGRGKPDPANLQRQDGLCRPGRQAGPGTFQVLRDMGVHGTVRRPRYDGGRRVVAAFAAAPGMRKRRRLSSFFFEWAV